MIKGINRTILNGIKSDIRPYFWDQKNAYNELKALLKIPYNKYDKRQKCAERIIKYQLTYHVKGEIFKFVSELSRVEPVVMKIDKKLRDHIVHALLTFIFGIYIKSKWPKWDDCPECRGQFPLRWKFCAPLHDVAYPIEVFENLSKEWNKTIIKIKQSIQMEGENDPNGCRPRFVPKHIGGEISSVIVQNYNYLQNDKTAFEYLHDRLKKWDINLNPSDYLEWLKNKKISDHGVISAIVLLNLFDFIYQSHNPSRIREKKIFNDRNFDQRFFEEDIVSSTSAIFVHNINPDFLEENSIIIDFKKAPLAFLLCLSDKLQEWERYTPNREVYSPQKFKINMDEGQITFSMDIDVKRKSEIIEDINRSLCGFDIEII